MYLNIKNIYYKNIVLIKIYLRIQPFVKSNFIFDEDMK